MKSHIWWKMLVNNILEQDSISKNIPKVNNDLINEIADEIFTEFTKDLYWKKYDHCDLLLENLINNGYKLGIISNFDERLIKILQNLKMENYFNFILIPSNSCGNYKPQKEIFLQALIKSGVNNPRKIMHIGDSVQLDYNAAKSCNFHSILMIHDKESNILNEKNKYEYAINLKELQTKILETNKKIQ